jgi:hypothetical protein
MHQGEKEGTHAKSQIPLIIRNKQPETFLKRVSFPLFFSVATHIFVLSLILMAGFLFNFRNTRQIQPWMGLTGVEEHFTNLYKIQAWKLT